MTQVYLRPLAVAATLVALAAAARMLASARFTTCCDDCLNWSNAAIDAAIGQALTGLTLRDLGQAGGEIWLGCPLREVRQVPGVSGVHIMPVMWESVIGRVVEGAGLLPRPVLPEADQPEHILPIAC